MAKCKALKGVLNINEKSYVLLERSNNFIFFSRLSIYVDCEQRFLKRS